ncbi:hypothetical protein [Candidatus Binatus sp.]|uniref:hypothetical protein n=1 Tax=Candidatus Binatus sp. TaxID=2811406 RepID=UPI002FD8D364
MAKNRIFRVSMTVALAVVLSALTIAPAAHAQWFDETYPGFYSLQTPGLLQATAFAGGYVSDKYAVVQEGTQVEQSVTPYIGVFGRATGYQLWIGGGFESPLAPGSGSFPRLNFGRFQGGLDFTLFPGTHLYVSGGHDVADSDAFLVEGDFSSWICLHSQHPLNASFSSMHDFQNGVTSTEFDLQAILLSTEKYMILGGAGGAMYNGGYLTDAQGQGGPDVGFYYRPWQLGVSAQAGYGNAHQYVQISMYKQLSWFE